MSTLAWIAIGVAVVIVLLVLVSIAGYPSDNSF